MTLPSSKPCFYECTTMSKNILNKTERHEINFCSLQFILNVKHAVQEYIDPSGCISYQHSYYLNFEECKPSNNPAENKAVAFSQEEQLGCFIGEHIEKLLTEKHVPEHKIAKLMSDMFRYIISRGVLYRDFTSKQESLRSSGNRGSGSLQSQPCASNSQNADKHSRPTNVAAKESQIFNSRFSPSKDQKCAAVKPASLSPQVPALPAPKTSHPVSENFGDPVIVKRLLDEASTYKSKVPALCQIRRFVDEESFPACWEFHSLAQAMDHYFLPEPEGPPTSPNPQGPVMMVYELNHEKVNCDKLFNIFSLYGNILKIKFLNCKEGCAMIQMDDPISVERAVSNLNGYVIFYSKLKLGFSKQPFLNVVPQPFILPDGTPSFKDYTCNRNNRFTNPEAACMIRPLKVLHFFNAPFGITEDEMKKLFEDNNATPPRSVTFFISKNKSESSSGLIEFNTVNESLKGLALCNHVSISNSSGKFPHILKLCFSSTGSSGRVRLRGY